MDDERDESRDVADESEAEPGDYSQHDADQGYAEDDAGAYTGNTPASTLARTPRWTAM